MSALAFLDDRLDRVRGIDDDCDALLFVADEIRGTPEIVVDELREEHSATLAPGAAISLEVL
jgi:hypothetical protein